MFGKSVPICGPDQVPEDRRELVLLPPWNLADEILHQQAEHRAIGVKVLIPVPTLRVV